MGLKPRESSNLSLPTMKSKKVASKYFIRIEKGEKVLETLTLFCQENKISLGSLTGIGATSSATLGWYELSTKSYHWKSFAGNLEVTSLLGNVTLSAGNPFIHTHITISDEKLQTFGGHLKEAIVGATLEVIVDISQGQIVRKLDEEIGLNLFDL